MTLYKVAFTKGRERPRYTLLQRCMKEYFISGDPIIVCKKSQY